MAVAQMAGRIAYTIIAVESFVAAVDAFSLVAFVPRFGFISFTICARGGRHLSVVDDSSEKS